MTPAVRLPNEVTPDKGGLPVYEWLIKEREGSVLDQWRSCRSVGAAKEGLDTSGKATIGSNRREPSPFNDSKRRNGGDRFIPNRSQK